MSRALSGPTATALYKTSFYIPTTEIPANLIVCMYVKTEFSDKNLPPTKKRFRNSTAKLAVITTDWS